MGIGPVTRDGITHYGRGLLLNEHPRVSPAADNAARGSDDDAFERRPGSGPRKQNPAGVGLIEVTQPGLAIPGRHRNSRFAVRPTR